MTKRVADMTPEQLERERARYRKENMTPEQLEKKRARYRKENMTPEQLEKNRARHRKENMTPEELERERERNRKENMTPEQLERERVRGVEVLAKKAPDLEVFMLNKIDQATRFLNCTYRIPSICPPELAAKLAPVLEMLKTADAEQRAAIRGVIRTMRTARELELIEDGGTMTA
jgi:hypothetical protein